MSSKLRVNRGTTFIITLHYQKDGVSASLAGATVRFTVKTTEYDAESDDSTALVLKNITAHTDEAAGITEILLEPADTDDITPGLYYFDIKVAEASGAVYKIIEGRFDLDGSPTNRLS